MNYNSISELVREANSQNTTISKVVIAQQSKVLEVSEETLINQMHEALKIMKSSIKNGLDKDKKSISGLTGGDAFKMKQRVDNNLNICGTIFGNAMVNALAVSQTNACMGKIVASPTAGSCGILPSALITVADEKGFTDDELVNVMFNASGIGMVIAKNASISGAEGGCQAECGSASAMTASALVELFGGTPEQCENACAIAIKNILGLVCDPVAGLVEIPCIKRNASGVANAFVASELALADIKSAIPADEVILAMKQIGNLMSPTLKETAEGGLATTPTGKKLCKQVFG